MRGSASKSTATMSETGAVERARRAPRGALSRRVALCVAAASLAACARAPLTEILVVVDTDLDVPAQLADVSFRVVGPDGEEKSASADLDVELARPAVLALVHRTGPLGPLTIEVTGTGAGDAVVLTRTARVSFVPGRVVVLPMHLWARCLDASCGPDATCGDSGCRPVDVDAGELAEWTRDDAGAPSRPPELTGASYAVVAHGGGTTLFGAGLWTARRVTVGGEDVPFTVVDDGQIRLHELPDAIPAGRRTALVEAANGVAALELTIVHLVIAELDDETDVGADVRQLIELETGVPGVSLSGYVLVLFDGNGDRAYASVPLDAEVDEGGRLVIGSAAIGPDLVLPDNIIDDVGGNAVAVYQRESYGDGDTATREDLLDALVYTRDGSAEVTLTQTLLVGGGVVSEGATELEQRETSIQRCAPERRRGDVWHLAAPTPGAPNACP